MQSFVQHLCQLQVILMVAFLAASQPGAAYLDSLSQNPLSSISVIAISAGNNHTCALTVGGRVMCWGRNASGQLGDNTTFNRYTPVDVYGLSSGVASISTGGSHTCALTTGGAVKCWGDNTYGQLGDGTTIHRLAPVDVSGLSSGVAAVSAGGFHTCALTTGGAVKCWGKNGSGQLGNDTTDDQHAPANVLGLPSVALVSAGWDHTCARTTAGAAYCCGYNFYGQVGNNDTADQLTPVIVSGLSSGVASISAGGRHTCAVTSGGAAKCWGRNLDGEIGDGTMIGRYVPIDVLGLSSGVASISAGYDHTCARTSTSGAKCWGHNTEGELGDGTTQNRLAPTDVLGLSSGVASVSAGGNHTCAQTTGNTAKCWGANLYGQLGNNTTDASHTPTDVLWLLEKVFLPMIAR